MFINRALLSFVLLALPSLLLIEHSFAQSSSKSSVSAATSLARAALPRGSVRDFGPAPAVPDGPLSAEVQAAVETVFIEGVEIGWGVEQDQALEVIRESKDPRLAWAIADLLRFSSGGALGNDLSTTIKQLLNYKSGEVSVWND